MRVKIAGTVVLVLLVLSSVGLVASIFYRGGGSGVGSSAAAAGGVNVVVPFGPGSTVTLNYMLLVSNGSGWQIVDSRDVSFTVYSVEYPYINTSAGLIPFPFIRPMVDASQPYMVYVSYYFDDMFCVPVYPTGDGAYDIVPKQGCTLFLGKLRVRSDGLLDSARIVRSTGDKLIAEQVTLVAITKNMNTTVHIDRHVCLGPFSYDLKLVAPGAYLFIGDTVLYIGKPASNVTTIYLQKAGGSERWREIIAEKPVNLQVVVSSPFIQFNPTGG